MKTKYIVMMLALSVLLNAFFLGMMVSPKVGNMPFSHKRGGPGGPGPMEEMILHRVEEQKETLSPDGQKKVDVVLEKYRPLIIKKDGEEMPKLFDDIQATTTADKFDKSKLVSLHKQITAMEMKGRENVGNMMTDIASTLSDKDRIAFFKEFMPKPPKDGRFKDGPRDGPRDDGPKDGPRGDMRDDGPSEGHPKGPDKD